MNNNKPNEFVDYFYNTYINSLIFNIDNIKILQDDNQIIKDRDFAPALIKKLKSMNSGTTYPVNVLQNLKDLVDRVSKYTNSKNKSIINEEYKKLLFTKIGGGIYIEEYRKRFMQPEEIKQNVLYIEKGDICNSVMYDFALLYTLIDQDEEIAINDYCVYSMKAILHDFPNLFLDSKINRRAQDILDKQDESVLRDRLKYKIQHINKFVDNKIDYFNIKSAYKYILVQNMLIDKEVLQENIGDMDFLMETLKDIIDNSLIDNQYEQRNAIEMLDSYKNICIEKNPNDKKEITDEVNEYILKTNTLEFNHEKMVSELFVRFGRFRIIQILDNMDVIDTLIKTDLSVMNYLISGTECDLMTYDCHLSIRKILFMCPSLFDEPIVYERAMKLLSLNNNKNEIRKIKKIYKG